MKNEPAQKQKMKRIDHYVVDLLKPNRYMPDPPTSTVFMLWKSEGNRSIKKANLKRWNQYCALKAKHGDKLRITWGVK